MSQNIGDVPFTDLLLPRSEQEAAETEWPVYVTQPGFAFTFNPIMRDNFQGIKTLRLAHGKKFKMGKLKDSTTLDDAQCAALVGALSRNLALIQGPPGTGKSFCERVEIHLMWFLGKSFVAVQLVKVLLNSRVEAEMNPIICM